MRRWQAIACLSLAVIVLGCGGETQSRRSAAGTPAPADLGDQYPAPETTGVPAGWTPKQTRTSPLVVSDAGAVVEDLRLDNADLVIAAPDVTVRRVELRGGRINNMPRGACENGLVVEDTTIGPPPGARESGGSEGAIGEGGYTARRVKLWRLGEGFRVGGQSSDCGPVRIEDSFASIVVKDDGCADSHADGLQGYDAPPLTIIHTTIDFREAACGTAPFFVPEGQNGEHVDVNGLLLLGGGYPFRLGVSATVKRLEIADGSWEFGPLDVVCGEMKQWDASTVHVDDRFRVKPVRPLPCE